jgi:fructokinase
MNMDGTLWGIDLGGTKIEGIVMRSVDDATPLCRLRLPTEAAQGYEHILDQIEALVSLMKKETGRSPERIGIGTPGILDPRMQVMKNSNTGALIGRQLKKDLENKVGCGVTLANDANCFALAETRYGSIPEQCPGARVVFGIIMGTGVGGGLVVNGSAWNGVHGIAGEWGHNVLIEDGEPCYCGKRGCVETVISGPATEKFYVSLGGGQLSLAAIGENAERGEPIAVQTIDRLCYYFGKAVSVVVNIVDPDAIVIGGGVGNIEELYSKGVDSLRAHIFNDTLDIRVLRPKLGDSAGVIGAAALVAGNR